MNWQDDPLLQQAVSERRVRMSIVRSAIIWTPLFVVAAAALVFFLFDQLTGGGRGTWFLVVVLTILTILMGSQSIQSLLDLFQQPKSISGIVTRRWSRNDSLVLKSHYIRVEKAILRGDRLQLDSIKPGDEVKVRYYRHSGVLIEIELLKAAAAAREGPGRRP